MPARVLKNLIVVWFAVLVCPQMHAEGVPCWIRCHCPPKITGAGDVQPVLRSSVNRSLSVLARSAGILTTYFGKMLGIQGWRDYRMRATAGGKVVYSAGSTDGLYTIDLQLDRLYVENWPAPLPQSPTFIRIEVFPLARFRAPLPVRKSEDVCISGKLMWDADGFLEIHPKKRTDFEQSRCKPATAGK
jgi:hypothetical protein